MREEREEEKETVKDREMVARKKREEVVALCMADKTAGGGDASAMHGRAVKACQQDTALLGRQRCASAACRPCRCRRRVHRAATDRGIFRDRAQQQGHSQSSTNDQTVKRDLDYLSLVQRDY